MGKRYPKSATNMVIHALQVDSGCFFSLKELQEKVKAKEGITIDRDTIRLALKGFQEATNSLLLTKNQRRSVKRLPTKLYSYPKIQTTNELSTDNAGN